MSPSSKRPIKHLRWYIAALLCLAVFPQNAIGTVAGLGGFLGGVAGGGAQLVVATVVMDCGHGPIFAGCGLMYLVALAIVHLLSGELGVAR
jgi:ACS family hexuronate transporter-like MFS transporter